MVFQTHLHLGMHSLITILLLFTTFTHAIFASHPSTQQALDLKNPSTTLYTWFLYGYNRADCSIVHGIEVFSTQGRHRAKSCRSTAFFHGVKFRDVDEEFKVCIYRDGDCTDFQAEYESSRRCRSPDRFRNRSYRVIPVLDDCEAPPEEESEEQGEAFGGSLEL